jgi:iron complex outermembrane recepter protein
VARYVDSRYGDVTNIERVPSYTTVDLDLRYVKEKIWKIKAFSAGVSFYNLFDKRYIGLINVSDDTKQGSASYYAGAPFTVMGNVT